MSGFEGDSFGERLRLFRERAGLTQEELAERSGLSRDAISALERGRRQFPHPNTIRMLADGLNLTESERDALKVSARKRSPANASDAAGYPVQPHVLPNPISVMIGRQAENERVLALLDGGARLVTLTGPGGVGKSRLAIQVAREYQEHMPVAFVPLASVPDRLLVLPAIAQALRLRTGEGTALEHLQRAIDRQPALLVLDNLEHLEDAHPDIGQLLNACPNLAVLATSRSTLRLSLETAVPVPPLSVHSAGTAVGEPPDAVALFVLRAQAARPEFRLTAENEATVRALCERLDGLPLAIELAAARIKVLSPAAMLARLESRLDLLAGGPRDHEPRLQNIRSALDWSFGLLDPEERATFCTLAVFAESFALEDAERVVSGANPDITTASVLDRLASLVEENLLLSHAVSDDQARFGMLQTVRDYAREQLAASGLEQDARSQHAQCYLALAESAYQAFRQRQEHEQWLTRLELERNNIRAALTWFADGHHVESMARLTGALYWFWDIRGPLSEGRAWLERVLALPTGSIPDDVRFQVLLAAGQLAHFQGDDEQAQTWSAMLYAAMPDSADPWMRATPLMLLGLISEDRGDYSIAEDRFSAALALFQEAGDAYNAALAVHHLGVTAWGLGDAIRATSLCSAALAEQQRLNDTWHLSHSFGYLGLIAITDNRPIDAARNLRECLEIRWRSGAREDIASSIADFAALAAMTDRPELAARLSGAAMLLRERIGRVVINLPERDLFETAEAATRSALSPAAYDTCVAEGAAMTLDDAVETARQFAAEIIGAATP